MLPVLKLARFESDGDDPASITYPVGEHPPLGAVHEKATSKPVAVPVSPLGALGALAHGPGLLLPTIRIVSFDSGLTSLRLFARRRTKYVPEGTPCTVSVKSVVPVSKFARLARPVDDPASTT